MRTGIDGKVSTQRTGSETKTTSRSATLLAALSRRPHKTKLARDTVCRVTLSPACTLHTQTCLLKSRNYFPASWKARTLPLYKKKSSSRPTSSLTSWRETVRPSEGQTSTHHARQSNVPVQQALVQQLAKHHGSQGNLPSRNTSVLLATAARPTETRRVLIF